MDFDALTAEATEVAHEEGAAWKRVLEENLLSQQPTEDKAHRVLAFSQKAPEAPESHIAATRVLYSQNSVRASTTAPVRAARLIPSVPERILDGPDLMDDYYLNLLDWGANNTLAVALGQTVYVLNADGSIAELAQVSSRAALWGRACKLAWGVFVS